MEILFEDAAITVAVKPPALLSEQTPEKNGFADLLAAHNPKGYVGVVHRLDRGVGGVMVYARTPRAAAALSTAVQRHEVQKEYLAILHGALQEPAGRLCDLLYHDRMRNKTFVVDRARGGVKEAVLDYERVAVCEHPLFGTLSLVRVKLLTGRTHQIRVQFASRKHPLLGDGKYGSREKCDICLFSQGLSFFHPIDHRPMHFSASPTGDVWQFFSIEI